MAKGIIEQDSDKRKDLPIATGVLDYFPAALAALAAHSKAGNDKHNPGQPMHWARDKSTDHADCIARHLIERGGFDSDGYRHSTALAWRALALLQTELEKEGLVDVPVTPRPLSMDSKPIHEDYEHESGWVAKWSGGKKGVWEVFNDRGYYVTSHTHRGQAIDYITLTVLDLCVSCHKTDVINHRCK